MTPEILTALQAGHSASAEHYRRFDAGEIPEKPFPANPYPMPESEPPNWWSGAPRSEYRAWNHGWVQGATKAAIEHANRA